MALSNLMVELFEKMSSWEAEVVRGAGLSLPHMHAVEIIGNHGRLIMKDLASLVGVTTGTMTFTVDKLEEKGLIERFPNPDDRRSTIIGLTEKGKRLHSIHTRAHEDMTRQSLQGFTAEEESVMEDLVGRFLKNFPEPK